jgi:hypothetical protein
MLAGNSIGDILAGLGAGCRAEGLRTQCPGQRGDAAPARHSSQPTRAPAGAGQGGAQTRQHMGSAGGEGAPQRDERVYGNNDSCWQADQGQAVKQLHEEAHQRAQRAQRAHPPWGACARAQCSPRTPGCTPGASACKSGQAGRAGQASKGVSEIMRAGGGLARAQRDTSHLHTPPAPWGCPPHH